MPIKVILTSNLPSNRIELIYAYMRVFSTQPRIAFIPPFTDAGHERFAKVKEKFRRQGFNAVDYYDIDEEYDRDQPPLRAYNIVYLSGGDPIRFRANLMRSGVAIQLREYAAADSGMVVAASGGSMQLSNNLSLFRLLDCSVGEVVADYYQYAALGVVPYEFLPHLDKQSPEFLDKVRRYSEQIDHDIVAVEDGSALLHGDSGKYEAIGKAVVFRHGEAIAVGGAF